MSAAAKLEEFVRGIVDAATGRTEERLAALEVKVKILEDQLLPRAAKPARAPASKARAGSADATGTAPSAK